MPLGFQQDTKVSTPLLFYQCPAAAQFQWTHRDELQSALQSGYAGGALQRADRIPTASTGWGKQHFWNKIFEIKSQKANAAQRETDYQRRFDPGPILQNQSGRHAGHQPHDPVA